jgi:hypothetical protein
VVVLEADDEVCKERVVGRWTHEASGRAYHVDLCPPASWVKRQEAVQVIGGGCSPSATNMLDDETSEALVQDPDDTPEIFNGKAGYTYSLFVA